MLSAAVKIEDLNDFILPSQDCVVNIVQPKKASKNVRPNLIRVKQRAKAKASGIRHSQPETAANTKSLDGYESDQSEGPDKSIGTSLQSLVEPTAAQVSLYDCLACSGCITTAETVLLQDQSADVFLERLKEAKFSVLSISSQSLDNLASHYRIKPKECFKKLLWILKHHLNISLVLDTSAIDCLVLVETVREYVSRYKNSFDGEASENDKVVSDGDMKGESSSPSITSKHGLPLLTSHCPGWICFMEKTQPPSVVNLVSKLKTSQQILGHLVKTLTVDSFNLRKLLALYGSGPNGLALIKNWSSFGSHTPWTNDTGFQFLAAKDVFHATVMPCYDKKLEIHRPENRIPSGSSTSDASVKGEPEVDVVLTTTELLQILHRLGYDTVDSVSQNSKFYFMDDLMLGTSNWPIWDLCLPQLPKTISDVLVSAKVENSNINFQHPSNYCLCCNFLRPVRENGESGGFLEYVFRRSAQILFDVTIPPDENLKLKPTTNQELKEILFKIEGESKMRFVMAYGFRNIQNVMKRVSHPPLAHFVEIMACPKGCTHGGGQNKDEFVDSFNFSKEDLVIDPHAHPSLVFLYRYCLSLESCNFEFCFSSFQGAYRSLSGIKGENGVALSVLRW